MIFYNDGSLKEETTAAGTLCLNSKVVISTTLETYGTVLQVEIRAIITAAIYIRENDADNKTIFICTDSQAATIIIIWVPPGYEEIDGDETNHRFFGQTRHVENIPRTNLQIPPATLNRDKQNFFDKEHKKM